MSDIGELMRRLEIAHTDNGVRGMLVELAGQPDDGLLLAGLAYTIATFKHGPYPDRKR